MPKRRHISASDRKRIAAVRLQGLAVAGVYQGRLARLRRAELRRVLALCKQLDDPEDVPLVLEQEIREDYLMGWWQKLWMTAGPPAARDTAQELRQAKAAAEDNIWLQALRAYATQRAGENIVSVTGTWKTALVNLTRTLLGDDLGIGVEKLTQRIFAGYTGALQEWQCRRIAQTEALIGMAEAGNLATQQLGVPFTKQWCTSGLPNVRESHQEVEGLEIDEDEPFELPGGLLMYPHDTHLGADASEIINCACACIRRPKSNLDTVTQQQPAPTVEPAPVQPTLEEQRIQTMMAEMDPALSEETRRAIALNNLEIEKALDITKGLPMNVEEADKQSANPNYIAEYIPDPNGHYIVDGIRSSKNPDYKSENWQYHINCATCTPAYVLRERGFDVTAKGKTSGSLNSLAAQGNTFAMWKNVDGTPARPTLYKEWMASRGYSQMNAKRYAEFFDTACKEPGTYAVTIGWKGDGGGHATIIKRAKDGTLSYIEPQVYDAGKGVLQSISELCNEGTFKPFPTRGVLRVDDKLFDVKKWGALFNK